MDKEKRLLVVAATQGEVQDFIDRMEGRPGVERKAGMLWTAPAADILVTGAGMVNTAAILGAHLAHIKAGSYGLIVNAGVAGWLKGDAILGQVYRVGEDEIYRYGAEDNGGFIPGGELGLGHGRHGMHTGEDIGMPAVIAGLPAAAGITVNTVHGTTENIAMAVGHAAHLPGVVLESMEGAAFYAACTMFMPQATYVQLRAVSNRVEPRNKDTWKMKDAIRALNLVLQELL